MFIGNSHVIRYLEKVCAKKTWAHAYFLYGPDRLGKMTAALKFSRSLLCENSSKTLGGCGTCVSCKMFDPASTGRFCLIKLETSIDESDDKKAPSEISIKAIRSLKRWVAEKSSQTRVVIIDGAHMLSLGASNALLKILEEPELSIVFLLVSSAPENVLPTIKSRAVPLRFNFVSQEELIKVKDSDSELVGYSLGRPGVLVQLISDPEFKKMRQQLFKYADDVYKGSVAEAFTASKELADKPEERRILVGDLLLLFSNDLKKSSSADYPLFRQKLAHFLESLRLEAITNVNPRLATDYILLQLQSPYIQVI